MDSIPITQTTQKSSQEGIFASSCSSITMNILFIVLLLSTVVFLFLSWVVVLFGGFMRATTFLFLSLFILSVVSSILARLIRQTPSVQLKHAKSNCVFLIMLIVYFSNIIIVILKRGVVNGEIVIFVHTIATVFYLCPVLKRTRSSDFSNEENIIRI